MTTRPAGLPVVNGDTARADRDEWLATNGIGGYAMGTVAGVLDRRYHGLLVAAVVPPAVRVLRLVKLEETLMTGGASIALFADRRRAPAAPLDPQGHRHLAWFRLEGSVAAWGYEAGGAHLERRVWMEQDANTTYIRYTNAGSRRIGLRLGPIVDDRDHHGTSRAEEGRLRAVSVSGTLTVLAGDSPVLRLQAPGASITPQATWRRGYALATETYRGLPDREDHLAVGSIEISMAPGQSWTVVATTESEADGDGDGALTRRWDRDVALLATACADSAPDWIRRLVLAADQFIVTRGAGHSVIAGYPWFTDWGRDTMIALPGLTLATGRPEVAASILRTYARFVDRGMLPNRFPDAGEDPEYNTVDATLWYFRAIDAYCAATGDLDLGADLFPVLTRIVEGHLMGTRHGIAVDPADGLLAAGEPGVQLTWMDARVGDHVVTPRIGKPVEVNALWHAALGTLATLAGSLGRDAAPYRALADRVAASFARFWNHRTGWCFDVIDGPDGDDPSLRPNQLLAVSLGGGLLPPNRAAAVVAACERTLLTPLGLRTLAPDDPDYRGQHGGPPKVRDAAYHQGTVWPWLLGPFVDARRAVGRAPGNALGAFPAHLAVHGIGSIAEIADGDPPHPPRGCIAQAWSVAEVLRLVTRPGPHR